MHVFLVSDFSALSNEHNLLNKLFDEGLEVFHLRKKEYSLTQMMQYLDAIPEQFHHKIVLHSHFQLLAYYNLKGSHFNKQYPLKKFRKEATPELLNTVLSKHTSCSVHSLVDIQKLDHNYDYVFISPVFDSISNRGYNAKIKIKSFQKFLDFPDRQVKVIALGGIKDENIPLACCANFDGVALLGHIWNDYAMNKSVDAAEKKFKEIVRLSQIHAIVNKAML